MVRRKKFGKKDDVHQMDIIINLQAANNGDASSTYSALEVMRYAYKSELSAEGMNSGETIIEG